MTISLAQAIRNAIAAEHAAEQFYLDLAQSTAATDARAVLVQFAGDERQHATDLELLARRLVDGDLPERADLAVRTIESAPGAVGATALDFDQALALALEAEIGANLFYDALASSCTGEVAAFFERVAAQEEGHAARIRAILAARGAGA